MMRPMKGFFWGGDPNDAIDYYLFEFTVFQFLEMNPISVHHRHYFFDVPIVLLLASRQPLRMTSLSF